MVACRRRDDFRRLARVRPRRSRHLWLRSVPDAASGECRVAYSVGRAVGTAVTRNRVRRRLRALVAERAARLDPGLHLVGAGPSAGSASFTELGADLDALLARDLAPLPGE